MKIAFKLTPASPWVSATPNWKLMTPIVVGDTASFPCTASHSGSYLTLAKSKSANPIAGLLDTVNYDIAGAVVQGMVLVSVGMVAGERAVRGST